MMFHRIQHTKTMEAEETTEDTTIIEAEEDGAPNVKEIGEVIVVYVHTVI